MANVKSPALVRALSKVTKLADQLKAAKERVKELRVKVKTSKPAKKTKTAKKASVKKRGVKAKKAKKSS